MVLYRRTDCTSQEVGDKAGVEFKVCSCRIREQEQYSPVVSSFCNAHRRLRCVSSLVDAAGERHMEI